MEVLNTTGVYSLVRHPLYVGNYISGLGIAFYTGIRWLGTIYTLSFSLYYERIIFGEAEFLRGKFGDDYDLWSGKTPAFISTILGFALLDAVMAVSREHTLVLLPIW